MRKTLNTILRIALLLFTNGVILFFLAKLVRGFEVEDLETAITIAALITLFNAILWPLIMSLALRFVVFTAGLGAIIINAWFLMWSTDLVEGVYMDLGPAIIVSVLMVFANIVVTTVLGIGERDFYYEHVVLRAIRRVARKQGREIQETDVPGVFFLEIDGLAEPVLRRAIANGHMPTVARWVQDGSHRIVHWECDLSSQTSASQAGLLQGSNHGIPAFRWYEKDRGKLMASSDPKDVAEIERRVSNGKGLLAQGGTSRGNLLSGDAPRQILTLSKVREQLYSRDFYAFFADPFNPARMIALSIWDILTEKVEASRQRRLDVRPRIDRGGVYPLLRVGMTVVMRDLNVFSLIGDMFEGVPVSYATFVGYDEVAHHSGVERRDALDVLRRLDQQFARIERVSRWAPRPYKFVVLSDHGQSQGATFLQRFGLTLEELVKQNVGKGVEVKALESADEAWGNLSGAMTQAAHTASGMTSTIVRGTTKSRTEDGAVALGPERERRRMESEIEREDGDGDGDVIVMASGNLGLVYLPGPKRRLTREEIDAAHPALLDSLAGHPGVGFLMVATEHDGPLILGPDGTHRLRDGHVEGVDPLDHYGPNSAMHLRRHDEFDHTPDILAISMYDPETDEVAAFEELVGSHGGLGGAQSHAFALVPSEWKREDGQILGAGEMHAHFKTWLSGEGTIAPD
jgi:uncharacterized membrane protein YvlD (DUF360 family)